MFFFSSLIRIESVYRVSLFKSTWTFIWFSSDTGWLCFFPPMLFRVFLLGSSIHLFIYSFIYLLPTQEAFVLTDACSGVAAKAQTDFLGIRATAHSKHSGLGKHTRRKSDLWTISCSGRRDLCPYWTEGRLAQGSGGGGWWGAAVSGWM